MLLFDAKWLIIFYADQLIQFDQIPSKLIGQEVRAIPLLWITLFWWNCTLIRLKILKHVWPPYSRGNLKNTFCPFVTLYWFSESINYISFSFRELKSCLLHICSNISLGMKDNKAVKWPLLISFLAHCMNLYRCVLQHLSFDCDDYSRMCQCIVFWYVYVLRKKVVSVTWVT